MRSEASTASPVPLTDATSATPDLATLGMASAAELWRCAFHAEAAECVRSMASVADSAKLLHFGGRFDDWRKTDLKATAVMQQHVKELGRLNQSLDRFLDDSGSAGNLTDFKGCLKQLRQLSGHVEDQRKRWMGLDVRLDQLSEQVGAVGELVRRQGEQLGSLETAEHAGEQAYKLAGAMKEMGRSSNKALTDFAGRLREGADSDIEALKVHFRKMLDDGGAIRRAMELLDARLLEWDTTTRAETARWRQQAEELERQVANLQEAAKSAKTWQSTAEQAHAKAIKLDQHVQGLETKLGETRSALEAATDNTLTNGMRRLKDLEARGCLTVNRQTGEVALLKPVDFAPPKAGDQEPAAEFANAATAAAVLQDVAELGRLFEGPIEVEVHMKVGKGGTPGFWDQVAERSAALVQTQLEQNGVQGERVNAKGFSGTKGLNTNCLVVRLDRQLFVDDGKSAGKRGVSPAPKRK